MAPIKKWIWAIPLIAVAACANGTDPVAVDPRDPAADFSKHGNRACYHVRLETEGVPGLVAEGTMSGDLEGTWRAEFDPDFQVVNGDIVRNRADVYWTVTGGAIPGLESFVTLMTVKQVPTGPGEFRISGKHRALSGVRTARLRYRGHVDLDPTPIVVTTTRGRICM